MQAPHPGIVSLPDDLLVRILAEVPFLERQRAPTLVCRSWRRLVVAPRLLRRIDFDSTAGHPNPALLLRRTRSLCSWLVAHAAGHVQQLQLRIDTPYRDDPNAGDFLPELASALTACASSLGEVRLAYRVGTLRFPAALAAALRGLKLLHIEVEDAALLLDVPLAGMSQLEELRLGASLGEAEEAMHVAPPTSLPASLTQLHLGGLAWIQGIHQGDALPPQLARLIRLQDLRLHLLPHRPEGYEVLAQLGGCLERLRLKLCSWLPSAATFAALTRLTLLSVDTFGEQREAFADINRTLEATLTALPQLQHLRCSFASSSWVTVDVPSLPSALTCLGSLRSFWWDIFAGNCRLPGPDDAWLQGLRHLALTPATLITNHVRLLADAPCLESLHVLCCRSAAGLDATLRLAMQHPALRLVHVELPSSTTGPSASDLSCIAAASQQRPDVRFSSSTANECGPAFGDEPS